MSGSSSFDEILDGFRSTDPAVQTESGHALGELTDDRPLTVDEALRALHLAAEDLPPRQDEWEDSASDLVLAAVTGASEELIPIVEEIYPRLPTPFARTAALRLLANIGTRDAAASLALLLAAPPDPREDLDAIWWEVEPCHGDLILPALLQRLGSAKSQAEIFDIALRLSPSESIASEHFEALTSVALKEAVKLRRRAPVVFDWSVRNLDAALGRRYRAERALAMLGHAAAVSDVTEELTHWLQLDPIPASSAAAALVRVGRDPAHESVARIAADPEARGRLFTQMDELGRLDLIPASARTQEALAESDLVVWLTYPTELARPPAEIRLEDVVSGETDDGTYDLYVFRFRSPESETEWYAGTAGPYRREDAPTTKGGWLTFSAFEPWRDRSPLDHAELVAGILESWANPPSE